MLLVIIDASMRSAALAALALAVVFLAGKRSAAFRHAVWAAALCGMLLMPALTAVAPPLALRVLPHGPAWAAIDPATAGPVVPVAAKWDRPPGLSLRSSFGWTTFALLAYLTVATAMLFRLALAVAGGRRLLVRARRVPEAGGRVFESDEITVPITVGGDIVLPSVWRKWEPGVLAAAVGHEGAHVRRQDWLLAVLAGVNRSIWWFHPAAWWIERRLAALAEEACDDAALAATRDREQYARALVKMAQAMRAGGGRVASLAPAMASRVSRRVDRILEAGLDLSRGLSRPAWVALLAASLPLLYGAAAIRLYSAQEAQTGAPQVASAFWREAVMDTAKAADLEQALTAHPDDLAARARLIGYYFLRGERGPWLEHMYWTVENHPEAELFEAAPPVAGGYAFGTSASDVDHARALWLTQADRRAGDIRVLLNAGHALAAGDFDAGESMLKRARTVAPEDPRPAFDLAVMYANAIRGAGNNQARGKPDRARVKTDLEHSTDASVVGITGEMLARELASGEAANSFGMFLLQRAQMLEPDNPRWKNAPAALPGGGVVGGVPGGTAGGVIGGVPGGVSTGVVGGVPTVPNARIYGGQARVTGGMVVLKPGGGPPAGAGVVGSVPGGTAGGIVGGVPGGVPPRGVAGGVEGGVVGGVPADEGRIAGAIRIRVGPQVQGAKLVKRVIPEYPPLARQAHIQGVVRFRVTIGAAGNVTGMQLISGHPLLVPAAQDAVRQYEYKPTHLNGMPAEVVTDVDVSFTIQ